MVSISRAGSMEPSTWIILVSSKTAHYMYNRIDLPNIGKELVSESLSLAGTFYKSCNIK